MRANKKDKLKNLLKQAGSDQVAEGFTDSIMNIIEADVMQEAALRSLLKQHPAEGPAFNFTAGVMAKINVKAKPFTVQPIITKRGWYVIATVFALFIFIAVASPNPGDSNGVGNSPITSLINQIEAIPATFVLAIAAIAVLLTADYLFTRCAKKTAVS